MSPGRFVFVRRRLPSRMLCVVMALGVFAILITSGRSRAQDLVKVTMEPLFGPTPGVSERMLTYRIEVKSLVDRPLRGTIVVETDSWLGRERRYDLLLDLPARETRSEQLEIEVSTSTRSLKASYLVGDETLGRAWGPSPQYGPGRAILVVSRDLRLRNALPDELASGAATLAAMHDESGDAPRLPRSYRGYDSVQAVVLDGPVLARLHADELAALDAWVISGGDLLIFVPNDNVLRDPAFRALAGDLARTSAERPEGERLVPVQAQESGLAGSELFTESYGGYTYRGFGRVVVAGYDGAARFAADPATQALIERVEDTSDLTDSPSLPATSFARLRSPLDPNETFRAALVVVALLLIVYVIVVGPLSFRWIARRNQPTLALITTPLAAAACSFLILITAYASKGLLSRHRGIDIVDLVEGERDGLATGYRGLFPTRPMRFSVEGPPRGRVQLVGDDNSAPEHVQLGVGPMRVVEIGAGFWETLFLQNEAIVEKGAISFIRDAGGIVAVVNGSEETLHGALLIAPDGSVFPVGDLAPGRRAAVDRAPAAQLVANGPRERSTLAERLGVGEDERELFDALVIALDDLTPAEIMLVARLDPDRSQIGDFRYERALRLLRVHSPPAERSLAASLPALGRQDDDELPSDAAAPLPPSTVYPHE